jgi:hypothetical protein
VCVTLLFLLRLSPSVPLSSLASVGVESLLGLEERDYGPLGHFLRTLRFNGEPVDFVALVVLLVKSVYP